MGVGTRHGNVDVAERWDRVFDVLSVEPRRQLVISLMDKPTPRWVQLPDAARSPHYEGSDEDLRMELYHHHLPKLAEFGYVEWSESPFEARKGPNFEAVAAPIRSIISSRGDLPDRLVSGCRTLENPAQ